MKECDCVILADPVLAELDHRSEPLQPSEPPGLSRRTLGGHQGRRSLTSVARARLQVSQRRYEICSEWPDTCY
jgi:hypothetical protein